jgi:phage FluMu protein Com
MEVWTELRCPACVQLGWGASRLLLKISGKLPPTTGAKLQVKCQRCKSLISWMVGTPILYVEQYGAKKL